MKLDLITIQQFPIIKNILRDIINNHSLVFNSEYLESKGVQDIYIDFGDGYIKKAEIKLEDGRSFSYKRDQLENGEVRTTKVNKLEDALIFE